MKRHIAALAIAAGIALTGAAQAQDAAVMEAVQDYMDFAPYDAGIILPEQINDEMRASITFVDTRDAAQFDENTIKGAINIDWREIPARLDELPSSGLVVLFCNTGSLSAQAAFAARLLGRENVVVLQSGLDGWRAAQGG